MHETKIYADRNMIITVLRNLIQNAIKYSNQNGRIDIQLNENQDYLEIGISDTGIGISEDIKNKLFSIDNKKIVRGTANEEGSGLGLVLCKEFIEKHGGKIWVESELGKGSSFKFNIPKMKINI
ncbi:MAG: ATP-binding protein [Bacteroidales bacterium]|nr:ATP-binding protein [Bacteroidales bacterium]MBN2757063.1 ATP-binding protein [Bacteroidales bacterium]